VHWFAVRALHLAEVRAPAVAVVVVVVVVVVGRLAVRSEEPVLKRFAQWGDSERSRLL